MIVRASTVDESRLRRVREIYESGFPAHLRSDFDELVSGTRADETALVLLEDGVPRGFAMLRQLGGTGWSFLRYFVVDGDRRGQGLGSLLWREVTAHLAAEGYTLLTFDVEDPDEPGISDAERSIREARIRFYRKQNAQVAAGYRTPSEGPQWTPMLLMAAPLGRAEMPAWRRIVLAVYRHRWRLATNEAVVREAVMNS
ncbi:GNAT family N-acetyltransferase [Allokutzneria sp. NRRL B-24872]|uniref:GNAT family N-acetyltransferase n=1 Tax=Allokutzneria sp. NRRL B-24872 TaxID=1137961 RepID=UPI000A3B26BE|nr:GNAT family N-acetyltransferase [Allokutzneria sp. NRRL B-24872]